MMIAQVIILEKISWAEPCLCITRIKVGIKATLNEPYTTLITNRGRRNAIRKASIQSAVPNHAATEINACCIIFRVNNIKRR